VGIAPEDCPRLPGFACSTFEFQTGANLIREVTQCSRCGWVDPAALDRWAEQALKESMDSISQRMALAASGEPFTFVESSAEPLSLKEALGQALAAASMLDKPIDPAKARRIYEQLNAFIREAQEGLRRETLEQAARRVQVYGLLNMEAADVKAVVARIDPGA
jgi:phage gp29-like protein